MIEYTLFFANPDTLITGRGAEHLFRTMDIAEINDHGPCRFFSPVHRGQARKPESHYVGARRIPREWPKSVVKNAVLDIDR